MRNKFDPPHVRTHKTCPKCRRYLPLESFDRSARSADGRHGYCHPCKLAYDRRRRKLKPPKARVRPVTPEAREAIEQSEEQKRCTGCKELLPLRSFSAVGRESGKPATAAQCRACKSRAVMEWRARRGRL